MEPDKKSNGAFVGLIIIIIILVVGGIYMWQANQKAIEEKKIQAENVTEEDASDLDNLDAELEATDTSTGVDVDSVQ
ncbi:hypothetical protein A2W67_00665 [Candidatus Nomurabacteria bacterium RIFCSPLOWO2_02_40_28]|uniref:Uncharacterized protein n=2 Tax=Candidatus Nomuraibacteriota TaxID=1752729 RepID=A0A837HWJ4_9BACT|nr:MAG: hypothetical protein UT27_C0003G0037 [Candidatus Nomurabacteria bacterium GW2011_GWD2_39_12]KKR20768.1 MAG: hypothetical protein UT51_C0002G0203 [Candidatus Nomurabacteria bacterium GW2011_GWC2_39_41]KKR36876.1 MAG: hypothetical protein UT70_C0005G0023 [Candidatus Nomurabacteria bacterium GW2011_GWE2_40_10]KKR38551.1 MAG: hypothetical protein UT73_C0002G0036 [Candidatus Nomurabacteria bacterium GW2011_GWB1_40_11]KKR40276.1 MAG: hypothetical protein UT74_C0001G0010 [Parcubacteria group b